MLNIKDIKVGDLIYYERQQSNFNHYRIGECKVENILKTKIKCSRNLEFSLKEINFLYVHNDENLEKLKTKLKNYKKKLLKNEIKSILENPEKLMLLKEILKENDK